MANWSAGEVMFRTVVQTFFRHRQAIDTVDNTQYKDIFIFNLTVSLNYGIPYITSVSHLLYDNPAITG